MNFKKNIFSLKYRLYEDTHTKTLMDFPEMNNKKDIDKTKKNTLYYINV
jgi:hypothetical protein